MSLYVDFHTEVKVGDNWINIDPMVYNIKKKENVRVSTYWNGSRTYISDTLQYFAEHGQVLSFDELGKGTRDIYNKWDKEELSWDQFTSLTYEQLAQKREYDTSMALRADVAKQFEKGEINEEDAYNFGYVDKDTYNGPIEVVKYNSNEGANYYLDLLKRKVDERKESFEDANNMIANPHLQYRVVAVWS